MSNEFTGKAGIVTGASSGIGRVIAEKLGEAGMELWLVGRSQEQLEVTAKAIKDAGGAKTHCVALDLAQSGALAKLVKDVAEQHPYLFTLINNAGVMYPEKIIGADTNRWHEMLAINLMTPMEGCHAAVEKMRIHGKPAHLINISSTASRSDYYGAYGVTKAALNQVGRTLRWELEGDDIRVTTIVPGGFVSNLVRGWNEDSLKKLEKASVNMASDKAAQDGKKVMGDPVHIANMILHVLKQPIEINFEEIIIRPAVSLDMK